MTQCYIEYIPCVKATVSTFPRSDDLVLSLQRTIMVTCGRSLMSMLSFVALGGVMNLVVFNATHNAADSVSSNADRVQSNLVKCVGT